MKPFRWLCLFLLAVTLINYPNPFNPKGKEIATFECTSDVTQETTLYIYNMAAQLLYKKAFSLQGGATNRLTWNGYSDYNESVGNGIYIYRLIGPSNKEALTKGKIWIINH